MAYIIGEPEQVPAAPQITAPQRGFIIGEPPAETTPIRDVGFTESYGRHTGKAFARGGETLMAMPGAVATIADNIASVIRGEKWIGDVQGDIMAGRGGALTDAYYDAVSPAMQPFESAQDYYKIKPDEKLTPAGEVGAVAGDLSAIIPMIIAGGGRNPKDIATTAEAVVRGMMGSSIGMAAPLANERYQQLIEQGVDEETAREAMQTNIAGYIAMGGLPIAAPGNMLVRGVTGGGIGAATGMSMRAVEGEVLGDKYAKHAAPVMGAKEVGMDTAIGTIMALIFGPRAGANMYGVNTSGGDGKPPGGGDPPPVDPQMQVDLAEYKTALEANGITSADDPRAAKLIEMIYRSKQRKAESSDAPFPDLDATKTTKSGREVPVYPKARDIDRAVNEHRDTKERIESGEIDPAAAPWANRQTQQVPPVIELGQVKVPGREEFVTTGTGEPSVAEGVSKYLEQRGVEQQQAGEAFTIAGQQRGRKQEAQDVVYNEELAKMEQDPAYIPDPNELNARDLSDAAAGGTTTKEGTAATTNERFTFLDPVIESGQMKSGEQVEVVGFAGTDKNGVSHFAVRREDGSQEIVSGARLKTVRRPANPRYAQDVSSRAYAPPGGVGKQRGEFAGVEGIAATKGQPEPRTAAQRITTDDARAEEFAAKYNERMEARLREQRAREEYQRREREAREKYQRQQQEAAKKKGQTKYTEEAAVAEDGLFRTDEFNFVVDKAGNPIKFANHKAAAKWVLTVGNRRSPRQTYELHNHPSGDGLTIEVLHTKPAEQPKADYDANLPSVVRKGGGEPPEPPPSSAGVKVKKPTSQNQADAVAQPQKKSRAELHKEQRARQLEKRKVKPGDSLLTLITRRGGMSPEAAREAGIDLAGRNSMRLPQGHGDVGIMYFVNRNGADLDTIREWAIEAGMYQHGDDYNKLISMIDEELRTGQKYHAYGDSMAQYAKMEEPETFESADEAVEGESVTGAGKRVDFTEAEADEWLNEFGLEESEPISPEEQAEIDAIAARDMEGEENAEVLQNQPWRSGDPGKAESQTTGASPEDGSPKRGESATQQRAAGESGREQSADDDPILSSYDEAELRQREDSREEAARAADARQREGDARQRADSERTDFTLTGSDRPADANPRQRDIESQITEGAKMENDLNSPGGGTLFANPINEVMKFGRRLLIPDESLARMLSDLNAITKAIRDRFHGTGERKNELPIIKVVKTLIDSQGDRLLDLAKMVDSKAIRKIHDLLHRATGEDRLTKKEFGRSVHENSTRFRNRMYDAVMKNLGKNGKKPDAAILGQVTKLLQNRHQIRGNTPVHETARQLSKLLDDVIDYAIKNGVDVQRLKDFFPRMLDTTKLLNKAVADRFEKALVQVYQRGGLSHQEAVDAAKRYRYAAVLNANNVKDNPFVDIGSGLPRSKHTKHRELDKAADELLRDFMLQDPVEVLDRYIYQMVRRAEFDSRFGGEIEYTGSDGNKHTGTRYDALRDEVIAEGNEHLLPEVDRLVTGSIGETRSISEGGQKMVSALQALSVIQLLRHATITSLTEPIISGTRTGSPIAGTLNAYIKTLEAVGSYVADEMHKRTGIGGKLFNDSREAQAMLEFIGGVENDFAYSMLHALQSDGLLEGGKWWRGMASKATVVSGLRAFTDGTRNSTLRLAENYLQRMAKSLLKGDKLAAREFRQNGADGQDAIDLANYILNTPNLRAEVMKGKWSKNAQLYVDSLNNILSESIMNPIRSERPYLASDPVAKLIYDLTGYLYSYHNNVLKRTIRMSGDALTMKGLSADERARLMAPMMLLPMAFGAQYMIGFFRDEFTSLPEEKKEAKDKPYKIAGVETPVSGRFMEALSRSALLGKYDMWYNVITGAKYEKRPSGIVAGAFGSGIDQLLTEMAQLYGHTNSPNTKTQEKNVARLLYNIVVDPALTLAAHNYMTAPAAAVASQTLANKGVREWAAGKIAPYIGELVPGETDKVGNEPKDKKDWKDRRDARMEARQKRREERQSLSTR